MTHTLEDEILTTIVLWGRSAAWATFAADYAMGRVEAVSQGDHMGLFMRADDLDRFALYRWATGGAQA